MSKLSSYLASKYLTADPIASSKKRKRKTPAHPPNAGLIIADDDADNAWGTSTNSLNDDEDAPQFQNTGSAEFRKAKKNAWKVVGSVAPSNNDVVTSQADADAAAADAIIASAAAENAAAGGDADEGPVVEGAAITANEEDHDMGIVKMGDGTHAGLQSAAAVSAQMERRRREELDAWEKEEAAAGRGSSKRGGKKGKGAATEEETVYRDATGRRIDISMRRAEARRELDEKAKKEREAKEAQKGDVQRAAEKQRREELEEARFMPLTRTADDEDVNRELRERDRWNDPAAMFLSDKSRKGGGADAGGAATSGIVSTKKLYKGAAPPNRYGIRPGYRWDGVDRGNGWEAERFKAINRTKRNKELDFAWQEDT